MFSGKLSAFSEELDALFPIFNIM